MAHHPRRARLAGLVSTLLLTGVAFAEPIAPKPISFPDATGTPERIARFSARILQGEAIVAHIAVHPPEEPTLLDPRSIAATWDGKPCHVHLFYRRSEIAFVAVLPPADSVTPGGSGTITVRAATLSDPPQSFEGTLSVTFPEAMPDFELPPQKITIVNTDGEPIPGAIVVGTRARYQLVRADAQGVAQLTAPDRTVLTPHLAYAPGYWTTPFDPARMSGPVILEPISTHAKFPEGVVWSASPLAPLPDAPASRISFCSLRSISTFGETPALYEMEDRFWVVLPKPDQEFPIRPIGDYGTAEPGFADRAYTNWWELVAGGQARMGQLQRSNLRQ